MAVITFSIDMQDGQPYTPRSVARNPVGPVSQVVDDANPLVVQRRALTDTADLLIIQASFPGKLTLNPASHNGSIGE